MQEILFEYEMHPTTWVYLSSLLIIGIYFKFHRLFSVRNLDLLGLIAMAPGLLLVAHDQEALGYSWLFVVNLLFLLRLLADPMMVRRPLLDPNLSASGLTFTGLALLVFLMTNVVTSKITDNDLAGVQRWEQILARRAEPGEGDLSRHGPGYPLFYAFADVSRRVLVPPDDAQPEESRDAVQRATTRITAILGHLAVVLGIVLIGYRHFDNVHTGVAMASLYLLLPYTAQMTGQVDHVVPGALLVWAVVTYRRPALAGILVGLAAGVIYYPIFLLPLWCSFYWRRGLFRFLIGVGVVLTLLVASLAFTSGSVAAFAVQLKQMSGWTSLSLASADGFWEFHGQGARITVMAAFAGICATMALWPAQKNLGTLLSLSAAVMLSTQFWHAHQGGMYLGWYLPLLVLTIFRPNLEDRVAMTAVSDTWLDPFRRGRFARLRRRVARREAAG